MLNLDYYFNQMIEDVLCQKSSVWRMQNTPPFSEKGGVCRLCKSEKLLFSLKKLSVLFGLVKACGLEIGTDNWGNADGDGYIFRYVGIAVGDALVALGGFDVDDVVVVEIVVGRIE